MIGARKATKGGKGVRTKSEAVKSRRGSAAKAGKAGQRPRGSAAQTAPIAVQRRTAGPKQAPAVNSRQARARAKARKAKAPKVIRIPLRERIINRIAEIDMRPHVWVSKVPFVVLVIGALGVGLAVTLWLSTDAAERSYQLSSQRRTNEALIQRKEALERDVLRAESAPALADSARDLGMIPSRDIAHLVQDNQGNWLLVGSPKPAAGVAPPPLNVVIPDEPNAVPKAGNSVEVPVQLPPAAPLVAVVPHMPVPAPAPDAPPAAVPGPAPDVAAPDAPQSVNGPNQPAAGEQSNIVATTNPSVPT